MIFRGLRKLVWAASAVSLLVVVRTGLSCFSYARLKAILPKTEGGLDPPPEIVDRCAWAVTRGSRLVPGATCLTQALSGRWLLWLLGYRSHVVIGVRPLENGSLAAHAWLQSAGRTVVGGDAEDTCKFQTIVEIGASP